MLLVAAVATVRIAHRSSPWQIQTKTHQATARCCASEMADEGRRMAKLREVLNKALDCAVQDASDQDFSSSYICSLDINEQILNNLCSSMLQNIRTNVRRNILKIYFGKF